MKIKKVSKGRYTWAYKGYTGTITASIDKCWNLYSDQEMIGDQYPYYDGLTKKDCIEWVKDVIDHA